MRNGGRETGGMQGQPCGRGNAPEFIALGLDLQDANTAVHLASTKFRATQVHQHPHSAASAASGAPHRAGHCRPGRGVVVGAVDAGDVHARCDQRLDQRLVAGRLAGQRDHDAHPPRSRRRTEQRLGMAGEQGLAAVDAAGLVLLVRRPFAAGQPVQDAQHLVEIGHHMSLGPTQRRHADPAQTLLQRSQVKAPQGELVSEVDRTRPLRRAELRKHRVQASLLLDHGLSQHRQPPTCLRSLRCLRCRKPADTGRAQVT